MDGNYSANLVMNTYIRNFATVGRKSVPKKKVGGGALKKKAGGVAKPKAKAAGKKSATAQKGSTVSNKKKTVAKKKKTIVKKTKKAGAKTSKIAKGARAKAAVFKGRKEKTVGGLKKDDLKRNKAGKIVSKRASFAAMNSKGGKAIAKWADALHLARKRLNIAGFQPVKKGSQLYEETNKIYKSML